MNQISEAFEHCSIGLMLDDTLFRDSEILSVGEPIADDEGLHTVDVTLTSSQVQMKFYWATGAELFVSILKALQDVAAERNSGEAIG